VSDGEVTFTFDGEPVRAPAGHTIAAALLGADRRTLRTTRVNGAARGVFCGIGACWDCLVVYNGRASTRACLQLVADGDRVETQAGAGPPR
jgi:aerobic-type carbon monoxide dehydrogenase small subunit (CoxS/CutS family)